MLPGSYVLAVSGGVDSMALLHLLAQKCKSQNGHRTPLSLVVGHFNHGMRPDAGKDEELVRQTAKKLGLPFARGHGRLGPTASEDQARQARYNFLYRTAKKHAAAAIITAHHQDDLVETAILNVLRGSGRRGLSSMLDNLWVIRPLASVSKKELVAYAKKNRLKWNEDSTNSEERYLRNIVRRRITPNLTANQRDELLLNIDKVAKMQKEMNELIATISQAIVVNQQIDRQRFALLPSDLENELMVFWLRQQAVEYDRQTVKRLTLGLKTAKGGVQLSVASGIKLMVDSQTAHFSNR